MLIGAVFLVPLEQDRDWVFGGMRVQVGLRVALRFSDQLEAFIEPGYGIVFLGGDFNGLCVNAGVSFR